MDDPTPIPDVGSITRWIGELKDGDPEAADHLWRRYFDRLVGLAHARLRNRPRNAGEDEEDAALSAFHSLWQGAQAGRFDRLRDRDDLWRLLVVLTARKASKQHRRRTQQKRGGGQVALATDLTPGDAGDEARGLDAMAAGPTPEFAAILAEEYRRRLDSLGDATLEQIARWRMEGYSNEEIARRLGCVTRTIERKLEVIRRTWMEDAEARD